MAVTSIKESRLRLTFEVGTDEFGEPIHRVKTYNNVKTDAQADQLYAVAQAIASLSSSPLFLVERNDMTEITE